MCLILSAHQFFVPPAPLPAGLSIDEMACGGVMDTDKTGSSNGSTGCDGDAKVEVRSAALCCFLCHPLLPGANRKAVGPFNAWSKAAATTWSSGTTLVTISQSKDMQLAKQTPSEKMRRLLPIKFRKETLFLSCIHVAWRLGS